MDEISIEIRKGIKKINTNNGYVIRDQMDDIFPNVTCVKSLSVTFYIHETLCKNLSELHCAGKQKLGEFTGKCRIYEGWYSGAKSIKYSHGLVESGKPIGGVWPISEKRCK